MKDRNAFECEVKNRASLVLSCESEESYVVPILEEFDTEQSRDSDQRYMRDIQNKRYSKLLAGSHEVNLSEYPYAIVMPLSKVGNMYDIFLHGSILGQKEARNAILQIGKAVQQLHQSGAFFTL
jgi:serine/threonine protein kinase